MSMKFAFLKLALLLAALTFFVAPGLAHDIPRDVTVQMFFKPEGKTLKLLMRVPLKGIMDIEFPHRNGDYVDVAKIDSALHDAANGWIADKMEIYENDRLLTERRIVSTQLSLESDRSFASYDEALAHVAGPPLNPETSIFWEQGILDVLFEYPIQSDQAKFSIHAA